jgi:2-aminoadipate transaminase
LPLATTRRLLNELLSSDSGRRALQYGSTAGDAELRRLTAERLRTEDGVDEPHVSADDIVITNGSQQMLYMLTECLCDPWDIILVEDPTYFVYLGIAQSHGLRCRGIRMQPDGIDLLHLETVLEQINKAGELRRLKFIYLVTYFQNPTGITTSAEKKERTLKLLRHYERKAGHPIYLLEDAAYRHLKFPTAPRVKSALATTRFIDRVIYTSTYSKAFATGVRVGFGILPKEVMRAVLRVKGNHDFGTANLLQHLVAAALKSGDYDANLTTLQQRYTCKARVMTAACRAHFPDGISWLEPTGGLYVWASGPRHINTGLRSKFFKAALAENILYVAGSLCYADDPSRRAPSNEMRLSFGAAIESNISEGIRRLGNVFRNALSRTRRST